VTKDGHTASNFLWTSYGLTGVFCYFIPFFVRNRVFWWTYVLTSIDYRHIHSLRSGSRVIPNDELDRR
jgi:hypothetical protein